MEASLVGGKKIKGCFSENRGSICEAKCGLIAHLSL